MLEWRINDYFDVNQIIEHNFHLLLYIFELIQLIHCLKLSLFQFHLLLPLSLKCMNSNLNYVDLFEKFSVKQFRDIK